MAVVSKDVGELVEQYFRDCAESDSLARYEEISKIAGFDVRDRRSVCYTAMAKVLDDYGYSFECKRNKGYKPLGPDLQSTKVGASARKKIKNTTDRWRRNYDAVDPGRLSQDGLTQYLKEGCKLYVVESAVDKSVGVEVDAIVEGLTKDSPLSPTNMRRMLKAAYHQLQA